jgi:hypothetical protein
MIPNVLFMPSLAVNLFALNKFCYVMTYHNVPHEQVDSLLDKGHRFYSHNPVE